MEKPYRSIEEHVEFLSDKMEKLYQKAKRTVGIQEDLLYTSDEVCQFLKIGKRSLQYHIAKGLIIPKRICENSRNLFLGQDVINLVK